MEKVTKDTGNAYLRFPALYKETLVFVAENDLWTCHINGGVAYRLTNTPGRITAPHFSPDGKYIAYSASDEGVMQVFVLSLEDGDSKRITYHASSCVAVGWTPQGEIVFRGSLESHNLRAEELHIISKEGGVWKNFSLGPATTIAFHEDKEHAVIQRGYADPAIWKRYRGGRCASLWYGSLQKENFILLTPSQTVQSNPFCYKDRIYFVSDIDGIGNIYSYNFQGKETTQHTFSKDYYVRWPYLSEGTIVYQMAGDIYKLDIANKINEKIAIQIQSCGYTFRKKFVSSAKYLDAFRLSPKEDTILLGTRGQVSIAPLWNGAVKHLGSTSGRNRLSSWHNDGEQIISVSDENGEQELFVYNKNTRESKKIELPEKGYIQQILPAPKHNLVAVSVLSKLYIVDIETKQCTLVDEANHRYFREFSWAPDGKWLAFAKYEGYVGYASIYIYSTETKTITRVTSEDAHDYCPCFDPKGRYLYFLSKRVFNPYGDSLQNDYNFPATARPYMVILRKTMCSPFTTMGDIETLEKLDKEAKEKEKEALKNEEKETPKNGEKEKEEPKVEIDLEGIEYRIHEIPIREGKYISITASKDSIFILKKPLEGKLYEASPWGGGQEKPQKKLIEYNLRERKERVVVKRLTHYTHHFPYNKMVLKVGYKIRIVNAGEEIKDDFEYKPGKETGWFNLTRLKTMVNPKEEWEQMFKEGWRWQRDFYWNPSMNNLDWNKMYDKYYPLLKKIRTRSELTDLLWEVNGELATSHAYVLFGEVPPTRVYKVGVLGVDLEFDETTEKFKFKKIYKGDIAHQQKRSPLCESGIEAEDGDFLLSINGESLNKAHHPYEHLLYFADQEVTLEISKTPNKEDAKEVTIKTLKTEIPIRYQQWVRENRKYVEEKTKGKIGYIHIPDMGVPGLVSFHKDFLWQFGKDGLIVDVRYNGGGHVSSVLLPKLQRKVLGYCKPRRGELETYPYQTPKGPIVALCDGNTGSDGDIFCQAFKDMKLGTLIGKRTWGGVVGIQPDKKLVDGGILTQPEFSFWFKSTGWNVENQGVTPDIEVDNAPQDYKNGTDNQLDKAIEVILGDLDRQAEEELPKL